MSSEIKEVDVQQASFVPRSRRRKKKKRPNLLFSVIVVIVTTISIGLATTTIIDAVQADKQPSTTVVDNEKGEEIEIEEAISKPIRQSSNHQLLNHKQVIQKSNELSPNETNTATENNKNEEEKQQGKEKVEHSNNKAEKEKTKPKEKQQPVEEVQANKVVVHEVKAKETLESITLAYFNSADKQKKIANFNNIQNPEKEIQTGMKLNIPDPQFRTEHDVVKGETLLNITNQYYGTTDYVVSLALHNGMNNPDDLKYGMRLKIPHPSELKKNEQLPQQSVKQTENTGKVGYSVTVNKSSNQLVVYNNNEVIKSFSVGTGKDPSFTPEGEFKIINKIEKPWYSTKSIPGGDPQNPLGSHWLGLNVPGTSGTTYGIHGTNEPGSIGGHVSLGCIRMHNADVQWLYSNLPVETPVLIVSN
ncbi:L,D-transpeptidase family protein [Alkalihalobacterium bogoriense]|uniref:L,D-transpeptidase family protein n=1 Tax=Alkalihalobacterium bogoriense TaxID=246272 RepID=UPI000686448E|nr:L,D-transpeptidase family protein [Alkalihalobacterium bogoriense]